MTLDIIGPTCQGFLLPSIPLSLLYSYHLSPHLSPLSPSLSRPVVVNGRRRGSDSALPCCGQGDGGWGGTTSPLAPPLRQPQKDSTVTMETASPLLPPSRNPQEGFLAAKEKASPPLPPLQHKDSLFSQIMATTDPLPPSWSSVVSPRGTPCREA